MTDAKTNVNRSPRGNITRRGVVKALAAAAGAAAATGVMPGTMRYIQAQTSAPIRIGFQLHRTGIGATYGRWYERVTSAAVKLINQGGGIGGRELQIVTEDDGTDPKRGAEVVAKFATQHKVDFVFGTLFSHVVVGSSPAAAEHKMPYFVVSEGYHVASGKMNRYVFQPGITDVRAQVSSMAPWVTKNLGKKVTMIFPDYAFGHDHRDYFSAALAKQGGSIAALIPIPATETSFTKHFARIPADTEVLYHVMVGPGVLTFVKEMGEHFGSRRPQVFGFIDLLEGVDIASPGLEFLDGSYFWEAMPRYAGKDQTAFDKFYRQAVGVNDSGAAVSDPKDVSTYSHMFGCWETLYVIKAAVEKSGYKSPTAQDKKALVEAVESMTDFAESNQHPQGAKKFVGRIHQAFGHQNISKVNGKRLDVVHRTSIQDGMYEPEADYTKMPL